MAFWTATAFYTHNIAFSFCELCAFLMGFSFFLLNGHKQNFKDLMSQMKGFDWLLVWRLWIWFCVGIFSIESFFFSGSGTSSFSLSASCGKRRRLLSNDALQCWSGVIFGVVSWWWGAWVGFVMSLYPSFWYYIIPLDKFEHTWYFLSSCRQWLVQPLVVA